MKILRTSLEKNKAFFLFATVLFLFGLCTGILFYFKQEVSTRQTLLTSLTELFKNNVFDFKNIFFHLLGLIVICALLFCFLGIPLLVIFLFFEGLSLGFIIPIFLALFKLQGIGYFLLYFCLIKGIHYFLLFYLLIKTCNFTKSYFQSLKTKKNLFTNDLKYILFFMLLVIGNDLCIYFVSNPLLIFLLGK